MNTLIKADEFKTFLCDGRPMLDVRAPVEFNQGAFPHVCNIPLLNDEQRQQVGLCYKKQGQDMAIQLGHKFISGETKSQLIERWKSFCQENSNAYLYCFRGGMRSHLVQQWLQEEGVKIPLIDGGYKAMRSYLLDVLEKPLNLLRISGQTGVGKTDLLVRLQNKIDLEALANHRGSAFGKQLSKQPSQIDFENNLAIEILKKEPHNNDPVIVEDEGRYIGSINLPHTFIQNMKSAPVIILSCPQEQRLDRIFKDYVVSRENAYIEIHPENGVQLFADSLQQALQNIQKRLGGVRYKYLSEIMQQALKQRSEGLHKKWISDLLTFYYDPMYQYQLERKTNKTVFSGDEQELLDYLENIND